MDHIPQFSNQLTIEIPYLCKEDYDGLSFLGYPQRKGWSKDWLFDIGVFGGKTLAETTSFLQTWLYFGLLSETLGVKVTTSDFVRESSTGAFITTRALPKYLDEWRDRDGKLSANAKSRRQIGIDICFDEVNKILSAYRSQASVRPLSPEVSLSIIILGETLSRAKLRILDTSEADTISGWDHAGKMDWGTSELLKYRMIGAGWCPSTIFMLQRELKLVTGLYYASSFPPPIPKSHIKCSDIECFGAYSYGHETYRTKHTVDCSGCNYVEADLKQLCLALDSSFPLLSLTGPLGNPRLEIIPYQTGIDYAAISFVWSDGLGNPIANALPFCQLSFIQRIVHETRSRKNVSLFWIDTLCVPLHYEYWHHQELAIRKMAQVFKDANRVIALDASLQTVSRHANYNEIAIRIALSPWTRRLWTLQEAALARRLYFQFSDGAMDLEELEASYLDNDRDLHNGVAEVVRKFYIGLEKLKSGVQKLTTHQQKLKAKYLVNAATLVWRAVQWRSTSVMSDETLAIATILQLDVRPLQVIHPEPKSEGNERRMATLLRMLEVIPSGMIFLRGPHLREKGLRWAPRSWITRMIPDHPDPLSAVGTFTAGYLTAAGLMVHYPGFILYFAGKPVGELFWIPVSKHLSTWYRVQYIRDEDAPSWNSLRIHEYDRPAIIISRPNPGEIPEIGVLASIDSTNKSSGLFIAAYKCRVRVALEIDLQRIGALKEMFLQADMPWAEALSSDQKWCIQ